MAGELLILLCLAAFCAGFVDAIVGGGGLIQTPVALILMPGYAVSVVIGTLKIPAFSGTGIAAARYAGRAGQRHQWPLLVLMMLLAAPAAFLGSWLQTRLPNDFMKPLLVVVLLLLLLYTALRPDFGQQEGQYPHSRTRKVLIAGLISIVLGLYDGFIGPGAGVLLLLACISLLGYDLMKASATAKLVNSATNFGSICLFLLKGKIIWGIALPMAVCNAAGGWLGAHLAIRKGNRMIRRFFLLVVSATLLKLAWEVWCR